MSIVRCSLAALLFSVSVSAQTFSFRSFVGKCLDTAPAAGSNPTVFLSDCRPVASQQIAVQEIPFFHPVVLHVGAKCIGTLANVVARGIPLELQDCGHIPDHGPIWAWTPASQLFRWDGDSLIAGDGSLVAQPLNGFSANQMPIVLGNRDLSDLEFWNASATDGTARKLISTVVLVPQEKDLPTAVATAARGAIISD
jgi:hypothetical protein